MEEILNWSNFYRHPRFWRHLLAWGIGLGLLLTILITSMNSSANVEEEDVIKLIMFLAELEVLIYATFFAYNKLQPQKRYFTFFLVTALLLIFISWFDSHMDVMAIQLWEVQGFWANIIVFPIFIFVAFGFKLAFHGARQLFVIQKLETRQVESELKLLKSQINPHFLFNTLNNIYSTNLEDHDKANDIILELADLLRYQLESNRKSSALLLDEIKSLENYIELEKIRVKDCGVSVDKKGNFNAVEIVPLLLLPFVENAFKYGTGIGAGEIDIKFELNEDRLFSFYCKNKIVQKHGKVHSSGIGLDNVKKRLALMYTKKYSLDIKQEQSYFMVDLKIQL